jgi:NAD(P)-dependent dehydrogenase (short-subunit alcohol dehydrogenase family)
MPRDFENQVVFVTGGGSGIGAAVAEGFAKAGAQVAIADLKIAEAEAVADRLRAAGHAAQAAQIDVTDELAMAACVADIVGRFGGLDHVVACAGIASRHTIAQMPVDTWRRVIDVNLTGAFLAIKSTTDAIAGRGGGSITLISSVAAEHIAYGSGAHYAASKSAHIGLVRHAAFELGRKGIRVNSVGPGGITNRMGGGRHTDERIAAMLRNAPLQRVVEPEDVADACMFLAGPHARAITGVYLPVDCGFLAGRGQPLRAYFEQHDEAF